MRKNIFLHFLNRDSREIFGLFDSQDVGAHFATLRRSLNAATLLCEDHCIMPPGFAIEDDIAFALMESQRTFLAERVLRLPMREPSLGDYAEKKRSEYGGMQDRYQGLFDDKRLAFLGKHAEGVVHRKVKVGEKIVQGWREAADRPRLWLPVKRVLTASAIELIRGIPERIADEGGAVTWSAIEPKLPREAIAAATPLRNSLQHVYFVQYCREFDLIALTGTPFVLNDFDLPTDRKVYDYHRFSEFLEVFGLRRILLDGSADLVVALRRHAGYISFADAYAATAAESKTDADMIFAADIVRQKSKFDWDGFKRRNNPLLGDPTSLDAHELADGMQEVAQELVRGGTPVRAQYSNTKLGWQRGARVMPRVVLFVALDEELEVLTKRWNLARHSTGPAASGRIGGEDVDVLCPRAMGRVPAAVETASYLAARASNKPQLILILGLAGGFEENDTKEGHILCAETVVDLALRKVTDSDDGKPQSNFRREDYKLNSALKRFLNSDQFKHDEWEKEAIDVGEWPKDRRPSLHYGLVASGDEIIASDEWSSQILKAGKLLGVEMEAGGVCAAAHEFGVEVSMLRTVSDKADPSKSDTEWRRRGMKTLALLVERVSFETLIQSLRRA